ncbi:MAG TPA: MmgE/PrpD family protein [Bryobacteraceae bacterium]|nr:MmgE/PrpD family protein [Bryobacteraceae bacterium]
MTRREISRLAVLGAVAGSRALAPNAFAQKAAVRAEPVTDYVARFIVNTRYEDIPNHVLELARKSILDGLGLALCGSAAKTGEIVREYIESLGFGPGAAGATVIGSSMKAPVRFAAFANAVGIHADDYDDTQLAVAENRTYGLLTHPTAPVLPAALAVAETRSLSGRELLLAYNLGVEVECKIAEAISPRHYEDGFHSTGTIGVMGAATAVAKLNRFDLPHVLTTLGIAASEGAGLRENFGTMTKPFHAGKASENGVAAADFAALGWTATHEVLEAPRGFFQAAGGGYDAAAILSKLGRPWTFVNPGVSIKPFPSGSLTHPGMTELERLIREHDIKPDEVELLEVGTNKDSPNALIHHHPKDHLQAKFSMEFCMAALVLYRKAGLSEFTDEVVNRPAVQQMISRVKFGVDPVAEAAGYNKMTTILKIHLKDGRIVTGRADFGKGSPSIPMSFDDVTEKFLDCAAFAKWPAAKAKSVVETVRSIEKVPDVRQLTALLG